jgi:hypothetical protein
MEKAKEVSTMHKLLGTLLSFMIVFTISLMCTACGPTAEPTAGGGEDWLLPLNPKHTIRLLASEDTTGTTGVESWVIEIFADGFGIAGLGKNDSVRVILVLEQPTAGQRTYHYLWPNAEEEATPFKARFLSDVCAAVNSGFTDLFKCRLAESESGALETVLEATYDWEDRCERVKGVCDTFLNQVASRNPSLMGGAWAAVKLYCSPFDMETDCPGDTSTTAYILSAGQMIIIYCSEHPSVAFCQERCSEGPFRNGSWCPTPLPTEPLELPEDEYEEDPREDVKIQEWLRFPEPGSREMCTWTFLTRYEEFVDEDGVLTIRIIGRWECL